MATSRAKESADAEHEQALSNARLDAYREAIQRCRWFVLVTVLISSLMLLHLYLEQLGQSERQLQDVIGRRATNCTEKKLGQLRAEIDRVIAAGQAPSEGLVNDWASRQFMYQRTSNDLENVRSAARSIPLLGMEVPANDYLPVMAFMLAIFVIALWLNVRSLYLAAIDLDKTKWANDIARTFFTFTGLRGQDRFQDWLAPVIQNAALGLPIATVIIASIGDISPMFTLSSGSVGVPVLQRLVALGLPSAMIVVCAASSIRLSHRVDEIVGGVDCPLHRPNHSKAGGRAPRI